MLLLLCASTAGAGSFPITSFEPDTTARRHSSANTVSLPVWVGLQLAPLVGDSGEMAHSSYLDGSVRPWDTEGTPWIGMSVAWPWTSPHESWLALGYEHWRYVHPLPPDSALSAFGGELLAFNTVTLDQGVVRAGFDQLIGRGHFVSGALGGGVGMGVGWTHVEQSSYTDWTLDGEALVHGLTYVRLGERTRIGGGATAGILFDFHHGGNPDWHWELEFRLDHTFGSARRKGP